MVRSSKLLWASRNGGLTFPVNAVHFPTRNLALRSYLLMAEMRNNEDSTPLGLIKVLPDESPPRLHHADRPLPNVSSTIYEWTPAPALDTELPPNFTLQLRCITGSTRPGNGTPGAT